MKVKDGRWSINTRDVKHGNHCLNHCLHFATAVAAGLHEALDLAEQFPNDAKNQLEMEKGNDYENIVLDQIKASLPAGDFDYIAEHSNSEDTRMAILNRIPVIAQAPLSKTFGNVEFNGRADVLVREDYRIVFTGDGTFAAVRESNSDDATLYTVWDIKHSEGKDKNSMHDYEMQVAMMAEGLDELGFLSAESSGLVMRNGVIVTFNLAESISSLQDYRAQTLEFLESHSPHAEHQLAQFGRFCQPKSKCDNAGCDHPDMCSHFRKETDDSSFLRSDSHTHFAKLTDAGLTTITAIAQADVDKNYGFDRKYMVRYVAQAKAVLASRESGHPEYIVIDNAMSCEAPISAPSGDDLYFDFEYIRPVDSSETHYFLGGFVDAYGAYQHFSSWGSTDEGAAMSAMIQAIQKHLDEHPQALVYHYDSPETTGIKALGERYGLSDSSDAILSRMVDLQKTVKSCLATSQNGIGLKAIATFFDTKGYGSDVASGGDASLTFYNAQKLRSAGETAAAETQFGVIRDYHEHDCELTRQLHNWLIDVTA